LTRIALVLCTAMVLGAGAVATAQGSGSQAQAAAGNAVGTARTVDETTLSLGDAAAPAKAANNAAGSTTLSYFLRMVVVLALVLAVIYGVYRLMKSLARPKTAEDTVVKVLTTTSLGPGKALHVVALGSKAYLIGATDASVSLVAEVEDKELIDALALEAALSPSVAKRATAKDFGDMLAGLMGLRGKAGRKAGLKPTRQDGDFLAGQRERLRKF
jgi:flagellar protein FliO/FliZ